MEQCFAIPSDFSDMLKMEMCVPAGTLHGLLYHRGATRHLNVTEGYSTIPAPRHLLLLHLNSYELERYNQMAVNYEGDAGSDVLC